MPRTLGAANANNEKLKRGFSQDVRLQKGPNVPAQKKTPAPSEIATTVNGRRDITEPTQQNLEAKNHKRNGLYITLFRAIERRKCYLCKIIVLFKIQKMKSVELMINFPNMCTKNYKTGVV